jgi:hypothetical protein
MLKELLDIMPLVDSQEAALKLIPILQFTFEQTIVEFEAKHNIEVEEGFTKLELNLIFDWSRCTCCGHSAKQRLIYYTHPGWPASELFPDLCEKCFVDITKHFSGNSVYEEVKRRKAQFEQNFVITDFVPIIHATEAALTYSI